MHYEKMENRKANIIPIHNYIMKIDKKLLTNQNQHALISQHITTATEHNSATTQNLHDPVQHLWTILDILVRISGQPNKNGEDVIELWQYCATRHPHHIVQWLGGIVPHIGCAVREAS